LWFSFETVVGTRRRWWKDSILKLIDLLTFPFLFYIICKHMPKRGRFVPSAVLRAGRVGGYWIPGTGTPKPFPHPVFIKKTPIELLFILFLTNNGERSVYPCVSIVSCAFLCGAAGRSKEDVGSTERFLCGPLLTLLTPVLYMESGAEKVHFQSVSAINSLIYTPA